MNEFSKFIKIKIVRGKRELLFLILILILAFFFRFYKLNAIPPGLYPDVAINGNDALETLKTGQFKVFYAENNGREGLMMWLIALSFSIFGVSVFAIKIVAAIVGFFTVVVFYFLTKEILNEKISLLSTFFLAISFWHINFSRIGFRVILLPLALILSFYFLLKGFKKKNFLNFILAGIFFGLGFYTYPAFRLTPLILPFIFIPFYFLFKKEGSLLKYFLSLVIFLSIVFLTSLPLVIYFLKNPQDFWGRLTPLSVFSTSHPFQEFLKSFIFHLGMFNFYGDGNWRHNISSSPLLFWPIGILFLIGIFRTILNIKKFPYYFLLAWWQIMLLPGILTQEGIPHALRTLGAIPPTMIFAGFGAFFIFQKIQGLKSFKNFPHFLLVIFLISLIFFEYQRYFIFWAQNQNVKDAFSQDLLKEGEFLNSLPETIKKYVIVNLSGVPVPWPHGLPMPSQTLIFLEKAKYSKQRSIYILPDELYKIEPDKETIILPLVLEKNIFNSLRQKFPQAIFQKKDNVSYVIIKK